MQQIDLLTSLPSTLSCIVLRDWLDLKAVMRLESAHSCRNHRTDFLELLESDEYFICEQVTIDIGLFNDYSESTMLKRFGEKMRFVKFVFSRRCTEEPAHVNLVKTHCRNLTRIIFSCVEVCTPELWALLRTNPNLEHLTISNADADANSFNTSFDDIVLPKLSTLVVINYNVYNKRVLGAMKMGNIVRLDLSWCYFVGSVLLEIAHLCPQLRAVVLSNLYIQGLTHELLNKFTSLCPHIAHLDISNAGYLTDAGMLSVVQNLKGLRSLKFTGTSQLTDTSLVHIYMHCADTLHTFMFDYNRINEGRISTGAISTLFERCTKLRTVHLNERCKVKGATPFLFHPTVVHNLTTLAIGGEIVCDQNLAIIGTYGVNLEVLEIDSYDEYHTLLDLVQNCSRLKKFTYNLNSTYDTSIPEILTTTYRKNIRPGLFVTLTNDRRDHWKPTKPDAFDF